MNQIDNIQNLLYWRAKLGYYPIHLFSSGHRDQFIMLNGQRGDFCLQLSNNLLESEYYYGSSWSSNTNFYISVNETTLTIWNWQSRHSLPIDLSRAHVSIQKIYEYIYNNSKYSSRDVVPTIVNIFKQIRFETQEVTNPICALNMLFEFLLSIEENKSDHPIINEEVRISTSLPVDLGGRLMEQFRSNSPGLPDLSIIMRHSAGAIFQEAQRSVIFSGVQTSLFNDAIGVSRDSLYASTHYTPSYIARFIVERAIYVADLSTKDTIKVCDPACGSGVFLLEFLKQMEEKSYSGRIIIRGFDKSESAIRTALFLLTFEKYKFWRGRLTVDLSIVEDSLTTSLGSHDIIFMNPPFQSWDLMNDSTRVNVVDTLGRFSIGRPNQASAFLLKALNSLNDGGVIGTVIPSSILSADYYSKFRAHILDSHQIEMIAKLGNYIFTDALVDVSVLVARRSVSRTMESPLLIWTRNDSGIFQKSIREFRKLSFHQTSPSLSEDYSIYRPAHFPVIPNNWSPFSLKSYSFINRIEEKLLNNSLVQIDTVFHVKQGIRTGYNQAFKINSHIFEALIPKNEQHLYRKVVDNESFENGALKLVDYIWYPYTSNGPVIKSIEDFAEIAPVSLNYFLRFKSKLISRKHYDETNWWLLTRPRLSQMEHRFSIISGEFGTSKSFSLAKNRDFVVERGHVWHLKSGFALKEDNYFYLGIFSSSIFDVLLSIFSKRLLAAWDLGPKFVNKIPIPNVEIGDFRSGESYRQISEMGVQLADGKLLSKADLNEAVNRLYS